MEERSFHAAVMHSSSAVLKDRDVCRRFDIHERFGGCLTDGEAEHNSKWLLLSRIHACPILDKPFKFSLVTRSFQAWQSGTTNVVPHDKATSERRSQTILLARDDQARIRIFRQRIQDPCDAFSPNNGHYSLCIAALERAACGGLSAIYRRDRALCPRAP